MVPRRITKFARSFSVLANDFSSFERLGRYPNVGALFVNGREQGSLVLIGHNFALTSAHCISPGFHNKKEQFEAVFSCGQRSKVKEVLVHSGFDDHVAATDIAGIVLEEPQSIEPAQLDTEKKSVVNDCHVVGFPEKFASTVSSEPIPVTSKLGIKAACYSEDAHEVEHPNTLEYRVGYCIDPNTKELKISNDPLHQATIRAGMSGGGLFKQNKLIGLTQSSCQYGPKYFAIFVPISNHAAWIPAMMRHANSPITLTVSQQQTKALENLLKAKLDPECRLFIIATEMVF